ncbi:hypothetical protein [Streptomyces sp. Amel2xC10]|uniref:hypothetical protein n=1 Tax=Streptomyces sp. Amel2xC10 TaxID=1305826 RepID=UPI000D199265|nr:hypothetical protein [Streptomyces sp. Amel2xC10]
MTALAACSQGGGAAKEPERGSSSPASVRPSGPSAQEQAREQVESHRQQVLAKIATGAKAPDGEGLSVVGEYPQSTAFFWSTPNGRYCMAIYDPGHHTVQCHESTKPFSRTPKLIRLYETDFGSPGGYVLLVAADRETIRSVTCGGAPVEFREIRMYGKTDAQRTLYALEFEGPTTGALKTRVSRADGVHTSTLPLAWSDDEVPPDSDWHSCGAS